MPSALVALGANLDDRHAQVARAVEQLSRIPATAPPQVSRFHETLPVGGPSGQQLFLNAAARLETSLSPEALHQAIQQIETQLGRTRGQRWGARTIDLDLILYDDRVIVTSQLQVPHPRMAFRRFVLEPAAEVAPDIMHPLIGWSVERLLDHLNHAPPYVAITGAPGSAAEELARAAAAAVGAVYLPEPLMPPGLAPSGDPSGRSLATSIQFLDRAATMLAAYDWGAGRPAVSGFCVDQYLAEACIGLETAELAQLEDAWQRRQADLVRPKLLVMLESWEVVVAARAPGTATVAEASARGRMLRMAARGGQPILCAGDADFDAQLTEITAALIAMQ